MPQNDPPGVGVPPPGTRTVSGAVTRVDGTSAAVAAGTGTGLTTGAGVRRSSPSGPDTAYAPRPVRSGKTAPEGAATGRRLRWWTELPLLVLVYGGYSAGRLLARGDVSSAVGHGLALLRAEKLLHLNAEHPLNRLFTATPWLGIPADFWYASLHYLVTPAVLVWLYRRGPALFRPARTWLMLSTVLGLIGFTLVPTCPPRLLAAGHGFVDTMAHYSAYGWWGGQASAPRGLGSMTNQYAAMPSLHVGWALWCGVVLWRHGRGVPARVAAVAYPLVTALVVMGTANHYLLDAVAGVAVMGVGRLLTAPALRVAEQLRARLAARIPPTSVLAPVLGDAARPARSRIVGGGCQTAAGERIPRQRTARGEPGARPADAGDGATAPAG